MRLFRIILVGLVKLHKFFKSKDILPAVSENMILREGSKKCHISGSKDRDWAGKEENKQALENREIKGICTLEPPIRWHKAL